jgi:hypothetical protein
VVVGDKQIKIQDGYSVKSEGAYKVDAYHTAAGVRCVKMGSDSGAGIYGHHFDKNDACASYSQFDNFFDRLKQENVAFNNDEMKFTFLQQYKTFQSAPDDLNLGSARKIPAIEHVVYLFDEDDGNAHNFPDYIAERVKRSSQSLEDADTFKHIVWTNFPNKIPTSFKVETGFEIRDIRELENVHAVYKNAASLISGAKTSPQRKADLTQASDIIRALAVKKLGGVYHDMDYEIFDGGALNKAMQLYDLVLGKEFNWVESDIANCVFASSPDHGLISTLLDFMDRNLNHQKSAPEYVQRPFNQVDRILFETGPSAMTAAYLKYSQDIKAKGFADNGIVFPPNALNDYYYARHQAPLASHCPSDGIQYSRNYEGVDVPLIGGDLFCGSWTKTPGFVDPFIYVQA